MNNVPARIHYAAMRIFAETGGRTLAISDLAREAGLSRGTIYNNVSDPNALFEAVCDMLADEMLASIRASLTGLDDPAERLARIVLFCVRRVHEDPHWGRFIARFAMAEPRLGAFWGLAPTEELHRGLASGRFAFRREQVGSVAGAAGGATFGAMTLVQNGHRSWRQAGSDTAEFILRGLGINQGEARRLAAAEIEPPPRLFVFDAA